MSTDQTDFRITFSIQRQRPQDDDFVEVGFGSSGCWDDVDSALHDLESIIQRGEWETEPGQPAPDELKPSR